MEWMVFFFSLCVSLVWCSHKRRIQKHLLYSCCRCFCFIYCKWILSWIVTQQIFEEKFSSVFFFWYCYGQIRANAWCTRQTGGKTVNEKRYLHAPQESSHNKKENIRDEWRRWWRVCVPNKDKACQKRYIVIRKTPILRTPTFYSNTFRVLLLNETKRFLSEKFLLFIWHSLHTRGMQTTISRALEILQTEINAKIIKCFYAHVQKRILIWNFWLNLAIHLHLCVCIAFQYFSQQYGKVVFLRVSFSSYFKWKLVKMLEILKILRTHSMYSCF